MEEEMEVDTLETRGTKRAAEENGTPPKPKRIRVSTTLRDITPYSPAEKVLGP